MTSTRIVYSDKPFTPATTINNGLSQALAKGNFAVVEKFGEIITVVSKGKTPEEAVETAIQWEPSLRNKIEGFCYEGDGVYVMPTLHCNWKGENDIEQSSENIWLNQYY